MMVGMMGGREPPEYNEKRKFKRISKDSVSA